MDTPGQRKRPRVESDPDSTKARKIREDLLSLLDDSDPLPDRDPASNSLESVIRSFEEELSRSVSPATVIDLTSDASDPLPEFGQFPGEGTGLVTETRVADSGELVGNSFASSGISELWGFQDELPDFDSIGVPIRYELQENDEYVALDGIFDYSDVNLGSEFLWQPDSLPAIK